MLTVGRCRWDTQALSLYNYKRHFLQHYIVNGSPCSYAVYFFVVGQIRGGASELNFDGKGQGMSNRGNFMYRVMGTCETMVLWGPGITSLWLKLKMSWDV